MICLCHAEAGKQKVGSNSACIQSLPLRRIPPPKVSLSLCPCFGPASSPPPPASGPPKAGSCMREGDRHKQWEKSRHIIQT